MEAKSKHQRGPLHVVSASKVVVGLLALASHSGSTDFNWSDCGDENKKIAFDSIKLTPYPPRYAYGADCVAGVAVKYEIDTNN